MSADISLNPRELIEKKKAEKKLAEEAQYTFVPKLDRGRDAPVVASKLNAATTATKTAQRDKVDLEDHADINAEHYTKHTAHATKHISSDANILTATRATKEAGWHGKSSQLSMEANKLTADPIILTELKHTGPQNVASKWATNTIESQSNQYISPEEKAKAEKAKDDAIHANAKKTTHTNEHVMKTNKITEAHKVGKYEKLAGNSLEEGWVDISRVHDPKRGAIPNIDLHEVNKDIAGKSQAPVTEESALPAPKLNPEPEIESPPPPAPVVEKPAPLAAPPTEHPYLKYGGSFAGDSKDTTEFKYVSFTEMPNFTDEHKSLMSKVLTPELFEKLQDVRSNKGFTLSNAIMTGVVTPHLGVGVTAGDEQCWELFKDLYYPVIKGWHGYDANTQKHPVDLDYSKLVFSEEQKEMMNKYVASTRIRAARNISGFSLPSGATAEDRAGVEEVLMQTFAGLQGELAGTYYELGKLSEEQTNFLLEKGFLFQIPSARNLLTGAGAARSWPDNRGIYHNDTHTALCWVNEEDHCRIISMEDGGDIPSVFKRFCNLSDAIKASANANNADLMWNETLGFMGTCPSNLGTGLRASVMVTLKEFNKLMEGDNEADKELLDQVCGKYDLQPRGSAGEHSAAIGGKFDVSNKQRIGFSEVELVQKMIDGVSRVIQFEEMLAAGSSPDDVRAAFTSE